MGTSGTAGRVDIAPTISISGEEERKVIFASTLGTIFEWYDFYTYATLAPFFAGLFFPPEFRAAALMSALATYAAGFVVRPLGALVFGRLGDLVGRKYTFLITILIMGLSTFAMGLLPTYALIGWTAPLLLVGLRLAQGLAMGGEYGGAAIYVAEFAPQNARGRATAWIQTTATLGLIAALIIILACRSLMDADSFAVWGWRLPFLLSIGLLVLSVYIRHRLDESPVFRRMTQENRGTKRPLHDALLSYPNNRNLLLALLGACAGQAVVWYTGQFYALFFLTITLHLDYRWAYLLIGGALVAASPFFVVFGALSDRIGRLRLILGGCLLASLTYFPLFQGLSRSVNPDLADFRARTAITVAADNCRVHVFVGPWTRFTACDRMQSQLSSAGVSFDIVPGLAGRDVVTTIGGRTLDGFDQAALIATLMDAGWRPVADPQRVNWPLAFLYLFVMALYVAAVYGPTAAFLVELFPARTRYTSLSLPYHVGNGWFGGVLPLVATALATWSGNVYFGLWYPVLVAGFGAVIGALFLRDRRGVDIRA